LSVHCEFVLHPVHRPATQVMPVPQFVVAVQLHWPSPGVPLPPPEQASTLVPAKPPQSVLDVQLLMFAGTHSDASGVPAPEHWLTPLSIWQPCPASTHLPLGHWLSAVHWHAVPDALH